MIWEILIASGIALLAIYLLYKNIKRSAEGKCTGCKEGSSTSCCSDCQETTNHK